MDLIIVLAAVLILSPFVLKIAGRQDASTKNKLRAIFQILLLGELLSGFFNWENLNMPGRSGFQLALTYPNSYLWIFFVIVIIQIILLALKKWQLSVLATILSFANTIFFFVGIILTSGLVGRQIVSFANIAAIFLVLIGNVVGLALVNRDKELLAKWLWRQSK